MRRRLILEEFSPELNDIKGSKNIVAYALSLLDKIDYLNKSSTNSNNNKVGINQDWCKANRRRTHVS